MLFFFFFVPAWAVCTLDTVRACRRALTPPTPYLFLTLAEVKEIDPFLVEYYRTIAGGVPGEVLKCAVLIPERRR